MQFSLTPKHIKQISRGVFLDVFTHVNEGL